MKVAIMQAARTTFLRSEGANSALRGLPFVTSRFSSFLLGALYPISADACRFWPNEAADLANVFDHRLSENIIAFCKRSDWQAVLQMLRRNASDAGSPMDAEHQF
jgi:hypothetical protein